jgi:hypothetical protein
MSDFFCVIVTANGLITKGISDIVVKGEKILLVFKQPEEG